MLVMRFADVLVMRFADVLPGSPQLRL